MRGKMQVLVGFACLWIPVCGVTQELERVENLALSGRAEDAREILTTWWEGNFAGGTRIDRQRGLWLRGLLTVDPDLASLDFQRLVVEYPGGPFTAEALVRLGGAADAHNDLEEAEGHFLTLLRDYPGSRFETLARAWLDARSGSVRSAPEDADRAVPEPEPARADSVRSTGTAAESVSAGVYTVQLGAFSSEAGALTLFRGAKGAGFSVRVVQTDGSRLFRVRVGRYRARDEAEAKMSELVDLGFEATVVSNADREGA